MGEGNQPPLTRVGNDKRTDEPKAVGLDPQEVHRRTVVALQQGVVELEPVLDPQELGRLVGAVKQYMANPAGYDDLFATLTYLYHHVPKARPALTRMVKPHAQSSQ